MMVRIGLVSDVTSLAAKRGLVNTAQKSPSLRVDTYNMKTTGHGFLAFNSVFLRLALGASFCSAVADRFGLWGRHGDPGVAWGDFAHFVAYTGQLNWFAPAALIPPLAWMATLAEIVLGLALIAGLFTRLAAVLSGILLLLFALAMTFALGLKAPLDFSVFSASAAAFALAACDVYPWSADAVLARPPKRR